MTSPPMIARRTVDRQVQWRQAVVRGSVGVGRSDGGAPGVVVYRSPGAVA